MENDPFHTFGRVVAKLDADGDRDTRRYLFRRYERDLDRRKTLGLLQGGKSLASRHRPFDGTIGTPNAVNDPVKVVPEHPQTRIDPEPIVKGIDLTVVELLGTGGVQRLLHPIKI